MSMVITRGRHPVLEDEAVTITGLHPGEPVFVFRAQDVLSLAMVQEYRRRVAGAGSFSVERMANLNADIDAILAWQDAHLDLVKLPD